MSEGLQGNIVTDIFYTPYALAEELLIRKLALVGTIRKNKPELPPQLVQIRQRAPRSSYFAFTKMHTAVSYILKRGKNVLHEVPRAIRESHGAPEANNNYRIQLQEVSTTWISRA